MITRTNTISSYDCTHKRTNTHTVTQSILIIEEEDWNDDDDESLASENQQDSRRIALEIWRYFAQHYKLSFGLVSKQNQFNTTITTTIQVESPPREPGRKAKKTSVLGSRRAASKQCSSARETYTTQGLNAHLQGHTHTHDLRNAKW